MNWLVALFPLFTVAMKKALNLWALLKNCCGLGFPSTKLFYTKP